MKSSSPDVSAAVLKDTLGRKLAGEDFMTLSPGGTVAKIEKA